MLLGQSRGLGPIDFSLVVCVRAVGWTLQTYRGLKEGPLLEKELSWAGVVGDLILFVVGLDEVGDYGTRLPKSDFGVGIMESYSHWTW